MPVGVQRERPTHSKGILPELPPFTGPALGIIMIVQTIGVLVHRTCLPPGCKEVASYIVLKRT